MSRGPRRSQDEVADPRDVGVHELIGVIENLCAELAGKEEWLGGRLLATVRAEEVIRKLIGPERESESRWSSRHIVVDEAACENLAASLAISVPEACMFFMGEPLKRAEKVAAWALDKVDDQIIENGSVHGARGRRIADLLDVWARQNQCGVYRDVVPATASPKSLERTAG